MWGRGLTSPARWATRGGEVKRPRAPNHVLQRLTIIDGRLQALTTTGRDGEMCSIDTATKRRVRPYVSSWIQPHLNDTLRWARGGRPAYIYEPTSWSLANELHQVRSKAPRDQETPENPFAVLLSAADAMLNEAISGDVRDVTARRYAAARAALDGGRHG